jgi:hypothetical protein
MKSTLVRGLALSAVALSSINLAQAHPGHDDGHELTWELGHLVEHPFATLLCVAVVAAATFVVWRTVRRANTAADQSLRGSQASRGK